MGKRRRYRLLDLERLCWRLGTEPLFLRHRAGQTASLNFRNGRQPLPGALQGQQLVSPGQSESSNAALGYAPQKKTNSPCKGKTQPSHLPPEATKRQKGVADEVTRLTSTFANCGTDRHRQQHSRE